MTRFKNVNHEQAGFIDCAVNYNWNLVPTVVATANPGGKVTEEAFDQYGGSILEKAKLRNWDGIALTLHGAMIVEDIFEAEGELLEKLREILGGEIPIAITLDLQANVTEMCHGANIIVSCKTYSHVDIRET